MYLLLYIFHPILVLTRFYHEKYSKGWDEELNRIMDSDSHPEISRHTAKFNVDGKCYEVWIANAYYSFGHIHSVDGVYAPRKLQRRPSISTMMRLGSLVNDVKNDIESEEVEHFLSVSRLRK
ncbi:hypothetical protein [Pantoea allii]|uniref:hypothetical protein n=1 Tax=Pantoea allii TaxID=574096 RepID=UPI0024B64F1B|nr:hypothetical protein [Pantoea allii]MDJ0087657.1 hypothetical protein [Pantoea allii]